MSGKYYPNNWKAIKDAPDELFDTCSYDDFETWKLQGWEIPSSVSCIIRAEDHRTGKVKEYTYKTSKGARDRLMKIMDAGHHTVTIVDHSAIHLLKEEPINDDLDWSRIPGVH